VKAIVRAVAAEYPDRVDARAGRGLAPRYIEHGAPCCLVAEVLCRLGWSVDQLQQLDHEGGRRGGGIRFAESRNPMLRRIDPTARELLAHIQSQQDRRRTWDAVVAEAFQEDSHGSYWGQFPRHRRPWVTDAVVTNEQDGEQ